MTNQNATNEESRLVVKPVSRTRETIQVLLANRLAVFGLVILSLLVFIGIFGKVLAPYEINEINISARLQGPSLEHWFGTDDLGRDVFTRVMVAARVSLQVGFIAVNKRGETGAYCLQPGFNYALFQDGKNQKHDHDNGITQIIF